MGLGRVGFGIFFKQSEPEPMFGFGDFNQPNLTRWRPKVGLGRSKFFQSIVTALNVIMTSAYKEKQRIQ